MPEYNKVLKDNNLKITVEVDCTEIDKAIEKAKELQAILKNCEKLSAKLNAKSHKDIEGITVNLSD